jgi:RNA polymerase sigma factor (sigma-70 family)
MTPLPAERAFERLYRRHATEVYRYAMAVLRNRADAEDVTQVTFINAYRALERGDRPRAPLNWLIAIAHNVCRQRFRAAARRPPEVELDRDFAESLVADDEAPTPRDMLRALGHLAFNQRAALVMREIEGRSYAEIADVLEVSVSAVEALIFRARRALREHLEGSLTCDEAELALSRDLDKTLPRAEKGPLRAHLRECADCARLARRQRAQRSALRTLGAVPLPQSLAGLFGGGGAVGVGLAAKAAAVVVTAGVVGAGAYDVHRAFHATPKPAAAGAHRKIAPLVASFTTGRALVPLPRSHAARRLRGMPLARSDSLGPTKEGMKHGHRQQAKRGRGLGGPEGRQARGQEEGAGARSERAYGRSRGRGGRGARGAAARQAKEAQRHRGHR